MVHLHPVAHQDAGRLYEQPLTVLTLTPALHRLQLLGTVVQRARHLVFLLQTCSVHTERMIPKHSLHQAWSRRAVVVRLLLERMFQDCAHNILNVDISDERFVYTIPARGEVRHVLSQ